MTRDRRSHRRRVRWCARDSGGVLSLGLRTTFAPRYPTRLMQTTALRWKQSSTARHVPPSHNPPAHMESALARTSIFRELPPACKATASADILLCTSFPITYGPGATTLNLVRSARAWRMPFVTQSLADRAHQALVLRTLLNETQTHRTSVVSWSSFDSVLDRCALVHPLLLVSSPASLRYRGATMARQSRL